MVRKLNMQFITTILITHEPACFQKHVELFTKISTVNNRLVIRIPRFNRKQTRCCCVRLFHALVLDTLGMAMVI